MNDKKIYFFEKKLPLPTKLLYYVYVTERNNYIKKELR